MNSLFFKRVLILQLLIGAANLIVIIIGGASVNNYLAVFGSVLLASHSYYRRSLENNYDE